MHRLSGRKGRETEDYTSSLAVRIKLPTENQAYLQAVTYRWSLLRSLLGLRDWSQDRGWSYWGV